MDTALVLARRLPIVLFVLSICACGGGGSTSDTVSGSWSSGPYPVYAHSITSGVPYSALMITPDGPALDVYDVDINSATWTTDYASVRDSNSHLSTINNASFVAPTDGTAYATVSWDGPFSYSLTWTSDLLTADGSPMSSSDYGDDVYYAFDAQGGRDLYRDAHSQ